MNAGQIVALVFGIVLTLFGVGCSISTIGGIREELSGGWLILTGMLVMLAGGIFLICLGAGAVH